VAAQRWVPSATSTSSTLTIKRLPRQDQPACEDGMDIQSTPHLPRIRWLNLIANTCCAPDPQLGELGEDVDQACGDPIASIRVRSALVVGQRQDGEPVNGPAGPAE